MRIMAAVHEYKENLGFVWKSTKSTFSRKLANYCQLLHYLVCNVTLYDITFGRLNNGFIVVLLI